MSTAPGRLRRTNDARKIWSGMALLAWLLAGCAAQPAKDSAAETARGDRNAASQLYAGQPAVVHATEFPVSSAAEGIKRGDEAWSAGKLDLAVYLYVQALAFDATAPGPFLKIGAIHEQLGNRVLAEKAYEFALEREPNNAAACERLGLLYLESARAEDARALFERAISLEPNRWRSHNGLGILADRHKDFAAAIRHYDRALEIEPKAASAMNNRGYSRFLAGDLAGAETDLKEAIRLGARNGAWTNLGRVQASLARNADALQSLLQEMDLPHAYNLLGEVAMERGDYDEARNYFESASHTSPVYFELAQKNLGIVNERSKAAAATLFVSVDADVLVDGASIGMAKRGDQVQVLETKPGWTRIRIRNSDGAMDLVGWVASTVLVKSL